MFLWYKIAMPESTQATLARVIGRWSLAALMVNAVIGGGVFGLPSDLAKLLGRSSPWAVLVAGAAVGIVMACFAEVASQFTQAGGPYLYARAAFGRLVGIEMGWMLWLTRLTSPAANANLFVIYLGEFWPKAIQPMPRFLILTVLIGVLTYANFRGVRTGTRISNIFTVAKLVPLLLVALVGMFLLMAGHRSSAAVTQAHDVHSWLKAILLMVFAYGGFETGLTPMSEAKDPRRDSAFALLVALITCAFLYTGIQWVVIGVLVDPAHSTRPLADVARVIFGNWGAGFIAVGAMVSVYGYLSANMLATPRITFALSERGDFPTVFSAIHPKFRTPYFSILVFAVLVWLLALLGSFSWNVTLSAVSRLFYYGLGCAALPVLRKKQPAAALFRLPGGIFFSALGVLVCLVLITGVDRSGSRILVATATVALINWLLVRRREPIETAE
ncbi:MAG: APC family permease [Terriglobales bacterium]